MDPATGRFVTQDPIPFLQRYAYVWDNPANASDPDGTCPRFIPGCDNAVFVFQFLTGTGSKNRTYGPNSRQISDVRSSPGADAVRQKFIAGGCLDTSGIPYGTARAFLDTYRHPTSTAFQVGGFANASVRNLGNGNIQISIPNDAGANSFFYHLVPNVPWSDGPLRTIHQTFEWTEPAPAACSRLPSGSKE
jgi:hypothetical protein